MLNNCHYNLMEAITIISKSLYRYDTYMKDSSDCKPCQEVWTRIKNHREEELKTLVELLESEVKSGQLSAGEERAAA
jgi:hypothetical protein